LTAKDSKRLSTNKHISHTHTHNTHGAEVGKDDAHVAAVERDRQKERKRARK
jgi:hypothetical protein